MELHRYPTEKPKMNGRYLVHYSVGKGYWDVIQWTGRKWRDWDYLSDDYFYPSDIDYWAELPDIQEENK